MNTVCDRDLCAGCMVCVESCPHDAIQIQDNIWTYDAVIQEDKCIGCDLCRKVCPQNNKVAAREPIVWKQGWTTEQELRQRGTSGGVAGAVAKAFFEQDGAVCSCRFEKGAFTFAFAESVDAIACFAGSKYVKSNPAGVYKQAKSRLKDGQKVLFIGLPCQVAAMTNYIPQALRQNLYTIDLICHGTPSPKVLECYLQQKGKKLDQLKQIAFRKNGNYQIYADGQPLETEGISDGYLIAFLNTACHTESCYSCQYAKLERVSDLTLGDSWGSTLAPEERSKGISLCLCHTEKGKQLLQQAQIHVEDVDLTAAVNRNQQLKKPPAKHKHRDRVLRAVAANRNFDWAVFCSCPKQYCKQFLKKVLKHMEARKH